MEKKSIVIKVFDVICLVLFIGMVVCALLQVFFRYVLQISVPQTEELARMLYSLVIFLSLVLIEGEDSQLKTTFFLEKLPYTLRFIVYMVINVASIAFMALFAYGAFLMFQSSQMITYGTMPWMTQAITYIPPIIAAPFVIWYLLKRIIFFKDTVIGTCADSVEKLDEEVDEQ